MQKIDSNHYIWAEKYRPQTIADVILPSAIKEKFLSYVQEQQIPNLLLCSSNPGVGKSSIANAIIKDLNADLLWINCSRDGNIDTARNKITSFATAASFTDAPKIVVMDEADGLSATNGGAQQALRGIIEEFSKNTRFIFTANYQDKLIEPIRNRLITFDFDEIFHQNKLEIGAQIFKRLKFILDNENVKYSKEQVQHAIVSLYPSVRKMIMVIQQSVINNELALSERVLNETTVVEDIFVALQQKNFEVIRTKLAELSDPEHVYTQMYSRVDSVFDKKSVLPIIMSTAKYLDMSQRSRDKYITLAAYFAEIILSQNITFLK